MRFVIVAGGVLSGLGKGVVSASIGLLLKARGFKVTAIKIDPYVSVDAGTMRPAEHGEVFVTHDGGEIDQDIGHYERFLNITLGKDNNITTGKVFQSVIHKERHFHYEGRDAELIPDVVNEIKDMVYKASEGYDFTVLEIGGTTGDLENMPFLHAAREIGKDYDTTYIMVTYLPYIKNIGELKTKPTQHAVARLREIGIVPDFIVTRNEIPIDKPRIETISKRCFIDKENIIDDPDVDNVNKVPLLFEKKKFAEKILDKFELKERTHDGLKRWKKYVDNLENGRNKVKVVLVGKYVTHGAGQHSDVYISVLEAINHAAARNKVKIDLQAVDSEELEKKSKKELEEIFDNVDGVVVPQGWGSRGTEGKMRTIKHVRENNIRFLGLCFGMQMATIEFARNVLGMKGANSTEVDPDTKHPVIDIMPDQKKYLKKMQYGGTIRLGAWPCEIKKGTVLHKAYKKYGDGMSKAWYEKDPRKKNGEKPKKASIVYERHRHRYEFNNKYKKKFEKKGFVISGTSPDGKLVEAIEIKDHPFFVGTQFHPEYISRPLSPHPIFLSFIESAKNGS